MGTDFGKATPWPAEPSAYLSQEMDSTFALHFRTVALPLSMLGSHRCHRNLARCSQFVADKSSTAAA
jgi:hypothetical protein